ncbi:MULTISPECIES: hypothetical protein [Kordiimonas]|uniref:hypothetical protein n=1 Tax=Kordiimonas TaxID=288021 RepID=UPI002580525E|nr:hypothetical protein [Kordiimonas sp. UBA4487]
MAFMAIGLSRGGESFLPKPNKTSPISKSAIVLRVCRFSEAAREVAEGYRAVFNWSYVLQPNFGPQINSL